MGPKAAIRFGSRSVRLLLALVVAAAAAWACGGPGERATEEPAGAAASSEARGAPQPTAAPALETAPAFDPHRWPGAGGEPLPFSTDEEVLAFLRDAAIVETKRIPEGVTEPRVVTLEAGGVRARAAFHKHHIVRERQRLVDGTVVRFFRDSYLNQPAAYEVARMLGLTNSPPTIVRDIDGTTGSLQLWIESSMTERRRRDDGHEFPDSVAAYRQVYDMDIFDALINNRDRSQGNFLWDAEWRLWMIDHTRAFGGEPAVVDRRSVRRCSRPLFERLKTLDPAEVDRRLAPFMDEPERTALVKRRDDLVRMLQSKIDAEGEAEVLFAYDDRSD
jgi:hypothetical protein